MATAVLFPAGGSPLLLPPPVSQGSPLVKSRGRPSALSALTFAHQAHACFSCFLYKRLLLQLPPQPVLSVYARTPILVERGRCGRDVSCLASEMFLKRLESDPPSPRHPRCYMNYTEVARLAPAVEIHSASVPTTFWITCALAGKLRPAFLKLPPDIGTSLDSAHLWCRPSGCSGIAAS